MVCHKAGPDATAQDAEALSGIAHHAPSALGKSLRKAVKEVGHENICFAVAHGLFVLLLYRSKVHVGFEAVHLGHLNSLPGVVARDLVEGRLFERTNGHHLAAVLNLVHRVTETVQLSQVAALGAVHVLGV